MKKFLTIILSLMLCFLTESMAQSVKTLQSDFVQTKHLKMLNDKVVSKGKMYYQATSQLRWEYTTPYTYTFIMNNNKVLLKKGSRKDVIDVNKNKMFKEIARIMMSTMIEKSPSASVTKKEFPVPKDMKQMYTKIMLYFNPKTQYVNKVEMFEKNGDYTEIQLNNVIANKNINSSMFAVQ